MAFQGSLKELPLPDIIQLVSVSGKTGRFTLVNEGHSGLIYLKNGQMVHAELGELIGEEAIYALAIWNSGDFQFSPSEEAPRQTITRSNTNLLMEAARRLDEWKVLSKKIPSVELVPELHARQNRREQIVLNPQEWMVITRLDGRHSIAEVGKALNLSAFDVAKVLYGLITSELVTLKKKSENPVIASAEHAELLALADRIRRIAEQHLGESGRKSIDKYFALAVDAIRKGHGPAAIDLMVREFEKAASLLGGLAVTERLRSEISEIREAKAS
ncbi:MAG: DUF4388 domain-containing protein [Thermoanaerobaculia bacterium]